MPRQPLVLFKRWRPYLAAVHKGCLAGEGKAAAMQIAREASGRGLR
jgi:hypothetical protein